MTDVTRILNAIEREDARATDKLLPLVYEDLRFQAVSQFALFVLSVFTYRCGQYLLQVVLAGGCPGILRREWCS